MGTRTVYWELSYLGDVIVWKMSYTPKIYENKEERYRGLRALRKYTEVTERSKNIQEDGVSGKYVEEENGDIKRIEDNKGKKKKRKNEKNEGGGGDTLNSVNKALEIFETLGIVMNAYQASIKTTEK